MTFISQRKGPKQDPPRRLPGDFRIELNLKKLLVVGREKKKYSARQCKVCAAHKK